MSASRAEKPITIRQRQDPRAQESGSSVVPIRVEDVVRAETGGGEGASGLSWSQRTGTNPHANDMAADSYKVGYCKPPLSTRFTSENQPKKRGRKPRPRSLREADLENVNALYPLVENGRPIKLNGHQIMGRARFKLAAKGNLRAIDAISRNVMPTPEELAEIENGRPLNENELNLWNAMIEIARGTGGDNDD